MALSVIVTSCGNLEKLRECIAALAAQPEVAEILVGDCGDNEPSPDANFTRYLNPTAVPAMRWPLVDQALQPVVAAIESRTVPSPDWAATILAAHERHPDAAAIGGAVAVAEGASHLDLAVWLCEYAAFAPPLTERRVNEISGANLSYKTKALRAEAEWLRRGEWETQLHLRWIAEGKPIYTCPATVVFHNGLSESEFARQRREYGRGYAAARCAGIKRLLYGFTAPALPFLLLLRTWRSARRSGNAGRFALVWPLVLRFHTHWSAGELLGYWFGPSSTQHVF